jgi:DNA-directed RNA polymerase specialized sigma24 family protein
MNDDQARHRKPRAYAHEFTRVMVDGESFTYAQICERTGLSTKMAQSRVRRARLKGKGVSWSHLQPALPRPK